MALGLGALYFFYSLAVLLILAGISDICCSTGSILWLKSDIYKPHSWPGAVKCHGVCWPLYVLSGPMECIKYPLPLNIFLVWSTTYNLLLCVLIKQDGSANDCIEMMRASKNASFKNYCVHQISFTQDLYCAHHVSEIGNVYCTIVNFNRAHDVILTTVVTLANLVPWLSSANTYHMPSTPTHTIYSVLQKTPYVLYSRLACHMTYLIVETCPVWYPCCYWAHDLPWTPYSL